MVISTIPGQPSVLPDNAEVQLIRGAYNPDGFLDSTLLEIWVQVPKGSVPSSACGVYGPKYNYCQLQTFGSLRVKVVDREVIVRARKTGEVQVDGVTVTHCRAAVKGEASADFAVAQSTRRPVLRPVRSEPMAQA